MNKSIKIFISILLFVFVQNIIFGQSAKTKISQEELKLYRLIMKYRMSKGLEDIPLSNALTYVAQTHCKDLADNMPDLYSQCNAHSWSSKGDWSSCCYTSDHKQANCMWNKPKELTSYKGVGYEIAIGSSTRMDKNFVITAEYAIEGWKGSYHHNNVVINGEIWKDNHWKAIGIGIHKGFAVVWFGEEADSEGEPDKPDK